MARIGISSSVVQVRTTSKVRGLHPLLSSWTKLVHDYCRCDRYDDNPWWYNERASLSTLAGAAWRLKDWYALEEFSTTKRGVIANRVIEDGGVVRGRCDLYVSHGSTNFAFEAKQVWQSMGVRSKRDHVSRALKAAVRDAGNLTADQADHRLGIVFVAPFIPLSEVSERGAQGRRVIDVTQVRTAFLEWVTGLPTNVFDAYAYTFVDKCSNYVSDGANPRVFPGAFLAVKRCLTGTRRPRSARV